MAIEQYREQALVLDRVNLLKLWLDQQVQSGKMTLKKAEEEFERDKDQGKLWFGSVKDSLCNTRTIYRLAADMKTWYGAKVYFVKGKYGELVIIKGWPAGRKILTGTRYSASHPKMIELQIGKPGIRAAAKESARFGFFIVVAADIIDYVVRDQATIGQLLASLTVDIPSVAIASAIGAAVGSLAAGTAVIGTIACGPLLVAFLVSALVGYGLFKLDQHYHVTDRLGEAYDRGLVQLGQAWSELGDEAQARWRQLENSKIVNDLSRDASGLAKRLGKINDQVQGELHRLW